MKRLNFRILIFFILITQYGKSQNNDEFVTSKYAGLYGNQYNHTYNANDFQDVSNSETLIIYPETDSSVLFYFQKNIGAPSYNIGQLYGRLLVKNNVGTYYENMEFEDGLCEFNVFFSDDKITVKTLKNNYNCGFGNNVFIDGEYDRKSRNKIDFFIDVESNKTFFRNIYKNEFNIENQDTDFFKIKQKISSEYNLWLKKGEFETTNEHLKRMELREFQFLEIFNEIVTYYIYERPNLVSEGDYYRHQSQLENSFTLFEYNADKELLPYMYDFKEIQFKGEINVPINIAQDFKEQVNYNVISFPKNNSDYVLFDNNIYPKKIFINYPISNNYIEVELKFPAEYKGIQISTNELKLENFIWSHITYDYSDYTKIKVDFLIQKAKYFENIGDLSSVIKIYEEIMKIDNNSLIANEKIIYTTNKLNEQKRDSLLKNANKCFNNGELSKSITLFMQVNSIRKTNEIDELIKKIKDSISTSNNKHLKLNEKIQLLSKNSYGNEYKNFVDLEKIKKGYGEKYNNCLEVLKLELDKMKIDMDKNNITYLNRKNEEVWTEDNQLFYDFIISFQIDFQNYILFNENIGKVIQSKNTKFLKILKEDNLDLIIETIINLN